MKWCVGLQPHCSVKRKDNGQQRTYGPPAQDTRRELPFRVKDPEAKSADLNVARQFLKDNGIDALPVENSPLSDLVKSLPDFADEDTDLSELKLN